MAALTTQQEYDAVREAIQQLSTLDTSGARRDFVTVNVDGTSITYGAGQMSMLAAREMELARRLSIRNSRKRVTPSFAGGDGRDY